MLCIVNYISGGYRIERSVPPCNFSCIHVDLNLDPRLFYSVLFLALKRVSIPFVERHPSHRVTHIHSVSSNFPCVDQPSCRALYSIESDTETTSLQLEVAPSIDYPQSAINSNHTNPSGVFWHSQLKSSTTDFLA